MEQMIELIKQESAEKIEEIEITMVKNNLIPKKVYSLSTTFKNY